MQPPIRPLLTRPKFGLHHRARGFTLVELMVTVAIVGILLSIALPSYQNYVMRGKIPDATATLSLKAVRMEQHFQDNKTYVGATACALDTATSKYFRFQCTDSTATTYTLVATGQDSMDGFEFQIDQNNVKQTTGVPAGWAANNQCWVSNPAGTC